MVAGEKRDPDHLRTHCGNFIGQKVNVHDVVVIDSRDPVELDRTEIQHDVAISMARPQGIHLVVLNRALVSSAQFHLPNWECTCEQPAQRTSPPTLGIGRRERKPERSGCSSEFSVFTFHHERFQMRVSAHSCGISSIRVQGSEGQKKSSRFCKVRHRAKDKKREELDIDAGEDLRISAWKAWAQNQKKSGGKTAPGSEVRNEKRGTR